MKKCTKCGETKAEGEFASKSYIRKDGTRGLRPWCKACGFSDFRKWKQKNRGSATKYEREWRQKNRFAHALNNVRSCSKRHGYKPCNATPEELEAAFTGRCNICGVPEIECTHKLALDHNHDDGFFRGFLCARCNQALGGFRDSEELLVDALHYLTNCKVK